MRSLPTGTISFLFTDVESSTKTWERDAERMRDALAAHDALFRRALAARNGAIFKAAGDSFCCAFDRPEDAVRAAVDAQRGLHDYDWPEQIGEMRVRMAVHTGTAVEREGDYFGPTLNRAARLMSIAHGGQILLSGSTAALVREALKDEIELLDLGAHRLKDLAEIERAYQVIADGLPTDFPALSSLDSHPNNLPSQISSFVGRAHELSTLQDLISRHRVITIVGPGGIGKTRLALQLAAEIIDDFIDGAWIAELASVTDASLIAQTVASALKIREIGKETIDATLARYLQEKRLLLIFDNCEQILSATANLVKVLSAQCPHASIVITSREPLHIVGENVFRVAALGEAPDGADLKTLLEFDSTRLFLERAQAVAPDARLEAGDATVISEICKRLEGIPLAIELAAARVRTIAPRDLKERLSKQLPVLVSRDATQDERHRTLKGTIDWSYRLLTENEQHFFNQLAVFSDSFTLDACEAVVRNGADIPALDALESLVDKSFVMLRRMAGATRFHILDVVEEYAAERLGRDDDLARRHFEYYHRLIAARETARISAEEQIAWFDAVAMEIGNARAALAWAIENDIEGAAAFLCDICPYWQIRGHIAEGRGWFDRYLKKAPPESPSLIPILRRASTFATIQDDYTPARALVERALELARTNGDIGGEAEALYNIAVIEHRRGDTEQARINYELAVQKFSEANHDRGLANAMSNLALIRVQVGEFEDADSLLSEAAGIAQRLGDQDLYGSIIALRGSVSIRKGDLVSAEAFLDETLAVKRRLNNRSSTAEVLNTLATLRIRQGRFAEARPFAAESFCTALELDDHPIIIYGFETFAEIALHEERDEEAARCLSSAAHLRERYAYNAPSSRDLSAIEKALRERLGGKFDEIYRRPHTDWKRDAEALCR